MYGKHFESTYKGSMMGAGSAIFAVWGYVIACTKNATIELHPTHLSMVLGEDKGNIEKAIEYLCSPDPESRSEEYEGRRLVREGTFQYFVVNHSKYRGMQNEEAQREAWRSRQQKHRSKQKEVSHSDSVTESDMSRMVTPIQSQSQSQKQSQKQKQKQEAKASPAPKPSLPQVRNGGEKGVGGYEGEETQIFAKSISEDFTTPSLNANGAPVDSLPHDAISKALNAGNLGKVDLPQNPTQATDESEEGPDAQNREKTSRVAGIVSEPEIISPENRARVAQDAFGGAEIAPRSKESQGAPSAPRESASGLTESTYFSLTGEFDADKFATDLMNLHPRKQGGNLCKQYILEAVEKLTKEKASELAAVTYLIERTALYRELTAAPGSRRYGSDRFYHEEIYDQPEDNWTNHDTPTASRQQQIEQHNVELLARRNHGAGSGGSARTFGVAPESKALGRGNGHVPANSGQSQPRPVGASLWRRRAGV